MLPGRRKGSLPTTSALHVAPTARNVAQNRLAQLARSVRKTMTSQHADSALSCVWEECRQIFAVPEQVRGFLVLSLSLRTRLEREQGQPAAGASRHATSSEAVIRRTTYQGVLAPLPLVWEPWRSCSSCGSRSLTRSRSGARLSNKGQNKPTLTRRDSLTLKVKPYRSVRSGSRSVLRTALALP
jgi:hypothetical protein